MRVKKRKGLKEEGRAAEWEGGKQEGKMLDK
jgi:hypothetical protein